MARCRSSEMVGKLIWAGEWVKIRNMMNSHYTPVDPRCELCNRLTCAVVWFSLQTRRIRCMKCVPWDHMVRLQSEYTDREYTKSRRTKCLKT